MEGHKLYESSSMCAHNIHRDIAECTTDERANKRYMYAWKFEPL